MLPLRILFLDEHLVAIDKPAGMIVHPGRDEESPEWIAMKRVRDELDQQVYVVHRLDRPTSGVLLFARDRATCAIVQQSFEQRRVQKTYLTVVDGVTPERWCCERALQKSQDEPPLSARTDFQRLLVAEAGSFPEMPNLSLSLLEARPYTGRYHQIRRHLVDDGHPIVGDYRYAGVDRSDELGSLLGTGTRMLLQAKVLEISHPYTGEMLRIEAPHDPDFLRCFPELSGEVVAAV
ncbi:pseudouridine synthase [Luteolibacter sp. GHJ8]|uniref:Pseudouridine synthase n=1 Tax=Luteolibacter rhizosphaerae TaxID=2989719 RepID=A0ABT3G713_9BACT|nr:pseudouridine synthase [Luteolibacter rhizosphaerae]MCW1915638.1 pseudouridine synthase [Luteolibacter rhizosphaerae]